MKVELTVQQLRKLAEVESYSWKALFALLAEGGSGDFAADLEELASLKLITKNGPQCCVNFAVDGVMPGTMVKPKKSANAMAAYVAIWQKYGKLPAHPKDWVALKRFAASYSWEEFGDLLEKFHKHNPSESMEVARVWMLRKHYEKAVEKTTYERLPEY